MNRHFLLFLTLVLSHATASGQMEVISDSTGHLMNLPVRISGNFGELRSNHFHSGIDYKTNEKTGFEVYAPFDGYVSRVRVASGGYGKALYLNHPNLGLTTVYSHLRAFYPAVEDSVRRLQYEKEAYELEFFPDSVRFPVLKGQLIGFSGNSGGSEGPHLHFETRNMVTEVPFDPEMAGFRFRDTIPPVIRSLVIYETGRDSSFYLTSRNIYAVDSGLKPAQVTMTVYSDFIIGFEAHDLAGKESNPLGIRRWQLTSGTDTLFTCRIDSFPFGITRLINAATDYPLKSNSGRTVLLCHTLPGNALPFYRGQQGILQVAPSLTRSFKLELADFSGNTSSVVFNVRRLSNKKTEDTLHHPVNLISFKEKKDFRTKNSEVSIPPGSFYDDVTLVIRERSSFAGIHLSPVLEITPDNLPVHEPLVLSLKPDKSSIPNEKLVLCRLGNNGMSAIGGTYDSKSGRLTAKVRQTGYFVVLADTTPPVIRSQSLLKDDLTGFNSLVFEVSDELSGVGTIRITHQDRWIRGEFNSYRNQVQIMPDDLPPATGRVLPLRVELTDKSGNKGTYEIAPVW